MTTLLNFYAGPGAGKTTLAAAVFAEMKLSGLNAEYVPEYAKELTWRGDFKTLSNQMLVSYTQMQHVRDLLTEDGPDYIVTDSPADLGAFYGGDLYARVAIRTHAEALHASVDVLNYFVQRSNEYLPAGRNQTQAEAAAIDKEILAYMRDNDTEMRWVRRDRTSVEGIMYELTGK